MLTPEEIAARRAYFKEVGYEVKVTKKAKQRRNYREDFSEMVVNLFIQALESNDKEKLQKFFQDPEMFDISATYDGKSLLYNAMDAENYDAMELLINNGAKLKKGELAQFKLRYINEKSDKIGNAARDRYTVRLVEFLQHINAKGEPVLNPITYTRELLGDLALGTENYYDAYNKIKLTTHDDKRIDFDLREVFDLTSESEVKDHIFKVLFENLAPKGIDVDKLGYLQDKLSTEQSLQALASGYVTFADLEKMVGDCTDQVEIDRRFDFLTSPLTLAMLVANKVSMDEIINENLYSKDAIIEAKEVPEWKLVDAGEIDETKRTWKEIFAYLMQVLGDMVQEIPHKLTSAYHHTMKTDKPKVKHLEEEKGSHVDKVSNTKEKPIER